jgi:hypothetical protein
MENQEMYHDELTNELPPLELLEQITGGELRFQLDPGDEKRQCFAGWDDEGEESFIHLRSGCNLSIEDQLISELKRIATLHQCVAERIIERIRRHQQVAT